MSEWDEWTEEIDHDVERDMDCYYTEEEIEAERERLERQEMWARIYS